MTPEPTEEEALAWLDEEERHRYCEDTWYSCPLEPDEGCANESDGDGCTCGADRLNAIKAVLRKMVKRPPGCQT